MGDLTAGYTWVNGANVTPARLNASVADAELTAAAISGKSEITAVADADEVLIWDASDSMLKRMTRGNLIGLLNANVISGQTAKTTPVTADEVLIWDSAASALKRLTLANLATLIVPTGSVLQTVYAEYTGQGTLSGNIPGDNTIPQSSEGDEILTAAITPRSASSVLLIRFVGCAGVNNQGIRAALFRDSTANAISATQSSVGGSNETQSLVIEKRVDAVAAVSTTFKIRTGSSSTYRINGSSGAGHLGAASAATLVIQEIKA
jgi:hypothetical protein